MSLCSSNAWQSPSQMREVHRLPPLAHHYVLFFRMLQVLLCSTVLFCFPRALFLISILWQQYTLTKVPAQILCLSKGLIPAPPLHSRTASMSFLWTSLSTSNQLNHDPWIHYLTHVASERKTSSSFYYGLNDKGIFGLVSSSLRKMNSWNYSVFHI